MSSTEEPPGMSGPDPKAPPVVAPEPDPPGPGTASGPDASLMGPVAEPAARPGAVAAARPGRRRGRTALIVAGAAALGVLAGTVTGYAVQYQRPPTPLVPLAQRDLAPSTTSPADRKTTARTISADRWDEKTDGDPRLLLMPKPDGAKTEAGPDWQDLPSVSAGYESPDGAFQDLLRVGFRRCARTSWSQGGVYVEITLMQFHDDTSVDSKSYVRRQKDYMQKPEYAGNAGKPIPDSAEGRVYVYDRPHTKPGYQPVYRGRAFAWRDGTYMDIQYENAAGTVSESALQALAKQQLERL
ncbi:hypothetical protein ABZ734_20890 [Streptomyces sp. NPDC006660]|uniref:hypothetical protein n=1 Tax=Streptomyces sp. NPDC006660 TaxID=3156901 RepID=UPI0033F326DA